MNGRAVRHRRWLPSCSPSQPADEFNEGLDWVDLLDALPDAAHSVAYTTYLDGQTVLPTPQLEDPADYLASLVSGGPILLGGENSGTATLATMNSACNRPSGSISTLSTGWEKPS